MENLSYRHNPGEEPLKYLTVGQLAQIAAIKYGNAVAIDSIEQNAKLTFQEALTESDKFAAGLLAMGMQKGDILGLWAPNCIEWYITNLACIRVGILVVPLNTATVKSDLEYYITKIGIKMIVCAYEGKHNRYYQMLMEVAPELISGKKDSLNSTKLPSLKGIILISEKQMTNAYNYDEIVKIGESNNKISSLKNSQINIDPDYTCFIHYSSGTTGKPKAIILSHFQVVNNSYFIAKRLEVNDKVHSVCVQNPLFHAFGTVMAICASLHFGTTLVLPSKYYNSTQNFAVLKEKKCSIVYGTPTMFVDLITIQQRLQADLDVDTALVAGSPCSLQLLIAIKSVLGIRNVKVGYGLTETTTCAFMSLPGDKPQDDSVGYLQDHYEVKVVDENGETIPAGLAGEICFRGYGVMLGYWNGEQNANKIIQKDGWLKTGDLGVLQRDGRAKIIGRTTDLIIRGGENIYPKEIEDFLSTHPSIVEAQVVGVPHPRLGEEICACIKLKTGCELNLSRLIEFCKGQIAHYKIPTVLEVVQDYPKTATGKVQKNVLKERMKNNLFK